MGDGVVSVLVEHPLVELLGALEPDRCVDAVVARDVEVADELVEEQTAQALGAAAVAGEQGTLDDLWKVDQGEHGPVEVGEVTPQHVGFPGTELLGDVQRHGGRLYGRLPGSAGMADDLRRLRQGSPLSYPLTALDPR